MESQQFEIRVDVYQRSILVCINETNEEVRRILVDSGYDKEIAAKASGYTPEGAAAYTWVFDDRSCLIRFFAEEITPLFQDQVAHEIFHCAAAILDYVGVKLGSKSEEAYAYLIGYITREFYENIKTV